MSKMMGVNEKGEPIFIEVDELKGKENCMPLMKVVDLIHDGIDDMYDWENQGEAYHEFVVESFSHALAGIDLLINSLRKEAYNCKEMTAEFERFIAAIRK